MKRFRGASFLLCCAIFLLLMGATADAAARKHTVVLGAYRSMPYSAAGDPAGAGEEEKSLKIRPLLVDGQTKEWVTGEAHDVTDRSFAVRRALRINDSLPTDKGSHWVWQRGPWLLVDRITGHATVLHLPDYDPSVSQLSWFRDYAAYCGLTTSGKQLYAVVAQVAARKPVLAKKLSVFSPENHPKPVCTLALWQRDPLRVTFQITGSQPVSFDVVGASAILSEDNEEDSK